MMNNNDIQEAIIHKLKADATLLALLATNREVREAQWQGINFEYPCVRVALGTQTPDKSGCTLYSVPFTISAISEKESSMEANDIAYEVSEALDKPFNYGTVKFLMIKSDITDAIRMDRTWVAKVIFAALVYYA